MDWMSTGEELVERLGGRAEVEKEIGELEWQDVPEGGHLTVGFMPGEAIRTCIRELRIPKVSAIAIGSFDRPAASPEEDGFYPGFYGIEGNYSNGRARIYVLDVGTRIQPLCSEIFPPDADVGARYARRLREAEAAGDAEGALLAQNDLAAFLRIPLDETEQGLTVAAADRIDAYVREILDEAAAL